MKKKKIKIIFTGGTGRFGRTLKKVRTNYDWSEIKGAVSED